jgi:hypothetical protein
MATSSAPRTEERRRVARQKSFLRGSIHFNNRRSVVDCLIRDISPYGARLIFSDTVTTPDVLELYIPQKEQTLRVHVIWRHGQEAGVAFAQHMQMEPHAEAAPTDAAASGPLAERVAKLEAEITALKRVLRKMKADAGPEFDVA